MNLLKQSNKSVKNTRSKIPGLLDVNLNACRSQPW